jgi:predicted RNA-binding protein associated with RNAse of E/G family
MSPALPPIVEVKRTLAGGEKRFDCRLLAADARHAVVLWVSTQPMHVHGVDLPAGTVSFGHFWADRPYNVYHWIDSARRTVGFYFNVCDSTRITPGLLEWRDLVVDVLALPGAPARVLDEDELPRELDVEIRGRIDAGKAAILVDPAAVIAEIEAASRALYPVAFGDGGA